MFWHLFELWKGSNMRAVAAILSLATGCRCPLKGDFLMICKIFRLSLIYVSLIGLAPTSLSRLAEAASSEERRISADRNADPDLKLHACSQVLMSNAEVAVLANARHQRGMSYFRKKQLDEAIADYNEALKLDPNFVLAWSARSLAFQGKGDTERALADLNEAVRIDPGSADMHLLRGNLFRVRKEWDNAEIRF